MSNDNIYKKNYSFGGSQAREFNVPDPTLDPQQHSEIQPSAQPQQAQRPLSPEEAAEYMRMRQQQLGTQNKLSDMSKSRVEVLSNLGRLTKEVNIDGIKYSLRTLKNRETQDATLAGLQHATNIEVMYEARRQFLARAISHIDGMDFSMVIGSNDLSAKLEEIDNWEEVVVAKLYDEFDKLRDEVKNKYFPKTDSEMKEVVEEIKK